VKLDCLGCIVESLLIALAGFVAALIIMGVTTS